MKIVVTKRDVVWSYLGTALNMSVNFILLPMFMFFISSDYLALWYIFVSLGSIVGMFDFGFNPVIARSVAYSWSGVGSLSKTGVENAASGPLVPRSPNYLLLKDVMATCRFLYLCIAVAALVVLLTGGSIYVISLLTHEMDSIYCIVAWFVYVVSVFLNLYFGYYAVLLRGVGKIADFNKATAIGKIIQILLSFVLLIFGCGLIGIAVANLAYGLIARYAFRKSFLSIEEIKSHHKTLFARVAFKNIKDTLRIIWPNAWKEGLVTLAKYLTTQAGTIVCSIFFTLSQTSIYSISVQIAGAVAAVSSVVFSSYNPSQQSAYARRDKDLAVKLLSVSMLLYFVLFVVAVIGVVFVVVPVLEFIGTSYRFDIPVLLSVCVFQFIYQRHANYAAFIANTNQIPYMKGYIISGFLGLVLSCIFLYCAPEFGVLGLVIPQIIVQAMYNGWKWPFEAKKLLGISGLDLLKVGSSEIWLRLSKVGKKGE